MDLTTLGSPLFWRKPFSLPSVSVITLAAHAHLPCGGGLSRPGDAHTCPSAHLCCWRPAALGPGCAWGSAGPSAQPTRQHPTQHTLAAPPPSPALTPEGFRPVPREKADPASQRADRLHSECCSPQKHTPTNRPCTAETSVQ